MIFQIHTPASPLNEFIQNIIYFEGFEPAHSMDRFLPDGNTELIIELTDHTEFIYDNEAHRKIQACARGWVSGVRTKPITIPSGRGTRKFIVGFKKGKAFPFDKIPMHELADRVVDADIIFGGTFHLLREQLLASKSVPQMFAWIEKFLLRRAGGSLFQDARSKCVEFAVGKISHQPDSLVFEQFNRQIGYSQKHFIGLFKAQVGVTPKQYLKIMRFQKTVLGIETRTAVDWGHFAHENGFYDQAHFIGDFREFSGFTPGEYINRKSQTLNYIPVG